MEIRQREESQDEARGRKGREAGELELRAVISIIHSSTCIFVTSTLPSYLKHFNRQNKLHCKL